MAAKIILIVGAGYGKTVLGHALAHFYHAKGLRYERLSVDGPAMIRTLKARAEKFNGFLILDTNMALPAFDGLDIWQLIEVHTGSVLKHEDLREMATETFGLSGDGLYGMPR